MNTIVAPSNTVTMSSREIARLCEKEHKNVKRDTLKILRALNLDPLSFERIYLDDLNRSQTEYVIDRGVTETLLTGYSIPLRHRVVTRLRELENVSRHDVSIPTNLPEALRFAALQAEQNLELQAVIQKQSLKVEALNRLANTQDAICITNAAKQLGVGPLKLFKWMKDNRWIYRRTNFSGWSAYQPRLSSGLLEHKLVKVGDGEGQELKVVEQVMVTRRGIVALAEQIQGIAL
ncbi:phage antirepressor KilAC domain-containing protein [Pseudomonas sp. QTF5]|uniref:phage antirepressor KilAC domain-containing protein n=1 Tax=Pseudomonas sp. QTF5 TaxID=1435425 RepID=UPI0004AE3852|nr:phage antirepressor KilAC domain-containing protein [Pseudomonas sp. QTF5]